MNEQIDNNSHTNNNDSYFEPKNDVAILLDLDNLVIGAKQAGLIFDIDLVLIYIKKLTNGRIVLRNSYGDWRQSQQLMKELATAGFTTQSTIRLNNFSKNLADMQIVVDTMDTLIDGHQYNTYVLMTGDRDFTPLVQSLRKRGKQVIGVGVRHTASSSFVDLCDQYIYYENIVPKPSLSDEEVIALLTSSVKALLKKDERIRASVLKQRMDEESKGAFEQTRFADGSFSKFLKQHADILELQQDNTTLYICRPQQKKEEPPPQSDKPLHLIYRSRLKKQKLRIVPMEQRVTIIKDIVQSLQKTPELRWRELIDLLSQKYNEHEQDISKNAINAVMLLVRRAGVMRTNKGKSLATAPVVLDIAGEKLFQQAVMCSDTLYLQEILNLSEPFDLEQAALALGYTETHLRYLTVLMNSLEPVI